VADDGGWTKRLSIAPKANSAIEPNSFRRGRMSTSGALFGPARSGWRCPLKRAQPTSFFRRDYRLESVSSRTDSAPCRPIRVSQNFRAKRDNKLTNLTASVASCVRMPCRYCPLRLPVGAPPLAPCIRQTRHPRTAGARQRLPDRFDLAWQRGASWALCMGLWVISCLHSPGP
jgi:hypothetical protein